METKSDCLYHLPTQRYQNVTRFYENRGEQACCHCRVCNYHILRVAAKSIVPAIEYDSGRFQANLKVSKSADFYSIVYLTPKQVEQMIRELTGE